MTAPYVVLPGEARSLDLGTFAADVLATGEQTGGAFSILRTHGEPPGFGPPLHIHRGAAEAFYVLEGEYLMFLDTEQVRCPAGSFVYVPADLPHTFQVVSDGPGTKLNLFAPAAMVGFFEGLALAEAEGRATPDELDRIAEAHGMTVLGPVPDTYLRASDEPV